MRIRLEDVLKKGFSVTKKAVNRLEREFVKNKLPSIIEPASKRMGRGGKVAHISAFSYFNAGDTLLPLALQDVFQQKQVIKWYPVHVHHVVDDKLIRLLNSTKGIVIGGGGLFLRDTNPNDLSGWQWSCSLEQLGKIEVPLVVFAVGYNKFRKHEEFRPIFREHIRAMADKSVYIGLRNSGSIEEIKKYLPSSSHEKIRYQPCMTTITSEIYPKVTDYEEKEEFIALNCAFDRSHLRYGENIGQICTDIAKVAKELSKIAPVKYYSHMHTDENILPFLQCYGVPFEVVRLYQTHPREIIRAYAKPSLVIGMRGHAQMIPFGCQTPIVSIVSHNKIQWFLEDIGKPEWGVDVLDTSFQENLFSKTKNVLNNKKEIQNEIRRIQQQLMNTTMENVEIATRAFGF